MVTRCSCIASSSADCVFGGVRLISSASRMLVKIGPGAKVIWRRPVVVSSWMMSVPVMSDGIRSGVNWMREKRQVDDAGQGVDEQRLGQPGHADDQAVAADEQREQHLRQHLVLADDELAQLLADARLPLVHPVGERDVVGGAQIHLHVGCFCFHEILPAAATVGVRIIGSPER